MLVATKHMGFPQREFALVNAARSHLVAPKICRKRKYFPPMRSLPPGGAANKNRVMWDAQGAVLGASYCVQTV